MEANVRICKTCKQLKNRIQDGKFQNGKDKRWRDESGTLWSGNTCPPCNNERLKNKMRAKRNVTQDTL